MGKAKNKNKNVVEVVLGEEVKPAVVETKEEIVIGVELEEFAKSMFPAKSETEEETNATNPFIDGEVIKPVEMDKGIRKMFVKIFKLCAKELPENSDDKIQMQEVVKFISGNESTLDSNARSQINLMLMNQVKAFDSIKNVDGGITERDYETFEAIAKVSIRTILKPSNLEKLVKELEETLTNSFDDKSVKTFSEKLENELSKRVYNGPVIPKTPYQRYTNRDRSIKLSVAEKRREYGVKYPC